MKKAQLIFWLLTPVYILIYLLNIAFRVITSYMAVNVMTSLLFLIPITAMTIRTVDNKEKNDSNGMYVIKITFVALLYLMVIFMFVSTLKAGLQ